MKKENIDKEIEDVLNEHIDITQKESINKSAFYEEIVTEEILKRYDKNGDLQMELMDKIKPSVEEKVAKKIEKEQEKSIDDQIEEVKESDMPQISKEAKEQAEEQVKKRAKNQEEFDVQKEVTIAVYASVMEEYYNLRNELYNGYNGQVKTGALTSGDKMEVKLVMYQNYLRKIDTGYKNKYGSFICQENKEIRKAEDSFRYGSAKSEEKINKTLRGNIQAIAYLTDKLDEISEDIVRISSNPKLMTDKDKEKLDALQQEYISTIVELNSLNPSIIELQEQIESREQISEFKDRVIGTEYERIHDVKMGSVKTNSIEYENDEKEEKLKEDINEQTHEFVDKNLDMADDLLNEFELQVQKDPVRAKETLESAELLINSEDSIIIDSRQKRIDDATEKYGKYSVQAECAAGVKTDKEILEIDIENMKKKAIELKEQINEKRKENEFQSRR